MFRQPLKISIFWKRVCQVLNPFTRFVARLLHERAHRQTINETARPLGPVGSVRVCGAIP